MRMQPNWHRRMVQAHIFEGSSPFIRTSNGECPVVMITPTLILIMRKQTLSAIDVCGVLHIRGEEIKKRYNKGKFNGPLVTKA